MAIIKNASAASSANALTTQLNTLANNTNTPASSTITLQTSKELNMVLNLTITMNVATAESAVVQVFLGYSLDGGTTWPDGFADTGTAFSGAIYSGLIWVPALRAVTTVQILQSPVIPLMPLPARLTLRNISGQTTSTSPGTAHSLSYTTWSTDVL